MARRMVHVIFVINCFARTGVAPFFSLFDTQVKKYFLNLFYSKKVTLYIYLKLVGL